jgi:hypothetical protein
MPELLARQIVEAHLGDILARLLCDIACHCKGAAE